MEWFEIAELLVELMIIILIMAFFFYLLIWVMDLSITCWNNIYKCPIKPPADTIFWVMEKWGKTS